MRYNQLVTLANESQASASAASKAASWAQYDAHEADSDAAWEAAEESRDFAVAAWEAAEQAWLAVQDFEEAMAADTPGVHGNAWQRLACKSRDAAQAAADAAIWAGNGWF